MRFLLSKKATLPSSVRSGGHRNVYHTIIQSCGSLCVHDLKNNSLFYLMGIIYSFCFIILLREREREWEKRGNLIRLFLTKLCIQGLPVTWWAKGSEIFSSAVLSLILLLFNVIPNFKTSKTCANSFCETVSVNFRTLFFPKKKRI